MRGFKGALNHWTVHGMKWSSGWICSTGAYRATSSASLCFAAIDRWYLPYRLLTALRHPALVYNSACVFAAIRCAAVLYAALISTFLEALHNVTFAVTHLYAALIHKIGSQITYIFYSSPCATE